MDDLVPVNGEVLSSGATNSTGPKSLPCGTPTLSVTKDRSVNIRIILCRVSRLRNDPSTCHPTVMVGNSLNCGFFPAEIVKSAIALLVELNDDKQ